MTKTRDLANLISDSKVGPTEVNTTGSYTFGSVGIGTASISSGFKLEVLGDVRFGDVYNDDAVELGWSSGGSKGFVQAYDRGASAFRNLILNNAVEIDSSGKVGIGTTSPSTPLHVVGNNGILIDDSGNGDGQLYFGGISGSDRTYLARSSDDFLIWNVANGPMRFGTNDTERMRIKSGGDVGIGTTSPTDTGGFGKALDVSSSTGAAVYVRDSGGSKTGHFGQFNEQTSIVSRQDDGNIAFYVGASPSEKMRIDSGGSVLIGQSTPTDLHNTWNHLIIGNRGSIISQNGAGGIDGVTISYNAYIDADTGSYAYIATDEASILTQQNGILQYRNAASGTAGSAITFDTKLQINSNGNVGIGTTNPEYRLDVSNTVSNHTSGLAVTNDQTGGYGSAINFVSKRSDNSQRAHAARIRTSGANSWNSNSTVASHLLFETTTNATLTERFRVENDGDIIYNGGIQTYGNDVIAIAVEENVSSLFNNTSNGTSQTITVNNNLPYQRALPVLVRFSMVGNGAISTTYLLAVENAFHNRQITILMHNDSDGGNVFNSASFSTTGNYYDRRIQVTGNPAGGYNMNQFSCILHYGAGFG